MDTGEVRKKIRGDKGRYREMKEDGGEVQRDKRISREIQGG